MSLASGLHSSERAGNIAADRTAIRCINEWSKWRGLPWGRWLGEGGRGDSIFSWADLKKGKADPTGPATKRMRDWARLLASVRVNAIAPQDVNWAEDNNYVRW